jgi:hypothetical protein
MLGNACFLSHQTAAQCKSRGAPSSVLVDLLDLLVVDASRARCGCICQRIKPLLITAAPPANRGQRLFRAGRLSVTQSIRGPKNDPRPLRITWLDLLRFAIKVSFSLSAGLRTIVATGLPIGIAFMGPRCYYNNIFSRDTSGLLLFH